MKTLLHTKFKDFLSDCDNIKKERLGKRLKDILELSPVLFRNLNQQRVKPMIMTAIDNYAQNPDVNNRLRLRHALENMGF